MEKFNLSKIKAKIIEAAMDEEDDTALMPDLYPEESEEEGISDFGIKDFDERNREEIPTGLSDDEFDGFRTDILKKHLGPNWKDEILKIQAFIDDLINSKMANAPQNVQSNPKWFITRSSSDDINSIVPSELFDKVAVAYFLKSPAVKKYRVSEPQYENIIYETKSQFSTPTTQETSEETQKTDIEISELTSSLMEHGYEDLVKEKVFQSGTTSEFSEEAFGGSTSVSAFSGRNNVKFFFEGSKKYDTYNSQFLPPDIASSLLAEMQDNNYNFINARDFKKSKTVSQNARFGDSLRKEFNTFFRSVQELGLEPKLNKIIKCLIEYGSPKYLDQNQALNAVRNIDSEYAEFLASSNISPEEARKAILGRLISQASYDEKNFRLKSEKERTNQGLVSNEGKEQVDYSAMGKRVKPVVKDDPLLSAGVNDNVQKVLSTLNRLSSQVKFMGDELYIYMKNVANRQKDQNKKQKFKVFARDFHVYTTLLHKELAALSVQSEENAKRVLDQAKLSILRDKRKKEDEKEVISPINTSGLSPEQNSLLQQYNNYSDTASRYPDESTRARIQKTEELLRTMNLGRMIKPENISKLTKGRISKLSEMDRQQAAFWLPFFLLPDVISKYDLLTRRIILEYIPKNYSTIVEGKMPQGHLTPLYWAAIGEVEKTPKIIKTVRGDKQLNWEAIHRQINESVEEARQVVDLDKFKSRHQRYEEKGFPKQLSRILDQFNMMKYSSVDKAFVNDILSKVAEAQNRIKNLKKYFKNG